MGTPITLEKHIKYYNDLIEFGESELPKKYVECIERYIRVIESQDSKGGTPFIMMVPSNLIESPEKFIIGFLSGDIGVYSYGDEDDDFSLLELSRIQPFSPWGLADKLEDILENNASLIHSLLINAHSPLFQAYSQSIERAIKDRQSFIDNLVIEGVIDHYSITKTYLMVEQEATGSSGKFLNALTCFTSHSFRRGITETFEELINHLLSSRETRAPFISILVDHLMEIPRIAYK